MSSDESASHPGFLDTPLSRRQVLKGAALLGGSVALGPLIAGCGSGSAQPSASASVGAPKKGGHLSSGIVGGSAKDDMDGHIQVSAAKATFAQNVYDSLVAYNQAGVLENALTEEVSSNADCTEWTIRLKKGVQFSNGKPVTADDVIFSLLRITDPKNPMDGATQLYGFDRNAVKKVDAQTIVCSLKFGNAVFNEGLAFHSNVIVPSEGYDPSTVAGAIGTGAFIVESFTPGEQFVLKANPNYWGEGPYVDRVTVLEFNDSTAKLNALLSGAVQHIDGVETAQASTIKSTPGLKLVVAKTGGWKPFIMQTQQKPFDDARVRQAFRLIAGRPEIITNALNEFGWLGNDMYGPYDAGYPKDIAQRTQDLEQAKSLLKQAGYEGNLSVELATSAGVGGGAVAAAQVFAEQAKGALVDVKVKNIDSTAFWANTYMQVPFYMTYWITRGYLVQAQYGSMPDSPYNETGWANPQWKTIVDEAFKTADGNKRNELISEASRIEYDQGGYILFAFDEIVDAHSDKIAGVLPDVSGNAQSACKSRYNIMYFTS
jgi:peptide/nickel transport system substrate-binding protein